MGKQMAVESEGLGLRKIYLDLDLCVFHTERKGILEIESKVSGSELENLARECFDQLECIYFVGRFFRQSSGTNKELCLLAREHTTAILLGEKRFRKAITSTKEKWKKRFC